MSLPFANLRHAVAVLHVRRPSGMEGRVLRGEAFLETGLHGGSS